MDRGIKSGDDECTELCLNVQKLPEAVQSMESVKEYKVANRSRCSSLILFRVYSLQDTIQLQSYFQITKMYN